MAEARAIAKSVVHTHMRGVLNDFAMINVRSQNVQVAVHPEGFVIFIPGVKFLCKSAVRKLFEFKIALESLLYPLPLPAIITLAVAYAAFMTLQPRSSWWRTNNFSDVVWSMDERFNPFKECFSLTVRVCYLATIIALVFILILMYMHRILLRMLLSYHGWIYERKPSFFTKCWAVLLKFLFMGGRSTYTYAYQRALPSLPVPSVKITIDNYLKSSKPTMSGDEYKVVEKEAQDFLNLPYLWNITGLLKLKALFYNNYVSDWWLRYVYLRGRSPILINSNYYGLGFASDEALPTTKQTARAGSLTHYFLKFKELLDDEKLETTFMRGLIPICMDQYQCMFSSCRIPMKTCDEILTFSKSESQHIVVHRKGIYFKVDIMSTNADRILSPQEFEAQFIYIMNRTEDIINSEKAITDLERSVAALTTDNRTKWASTRETEFSEGLNKISLDYIEKAVMIIDLSDVDAQTWSERARCQLHGDGTNRWCDKSFTIVLFPNGFSGLHVEHAWGDAPAIAHAYEWVTATEINEVQYDKKTGNFLNELPEAQFSALPQPTKLTWNFSKELLVLIEESMVRARSDIDDLQLEVTCHDAWGKSEIKKCKSSPDAFIQMALQLAFYRHQGYCPLTYESCMTRLFRDGRTDTIRSCTDESKKFVTMFDDLKSDKEELKKVMLAAFSTHSKISKDAMIGKGVDRHLFAMYVASMGLNLEVPFLQKALSRTWRLSTSQIPQRQTVGIWKDPYDDRYVSPSGGFGPVDDEGYGVSYMVSGDNKLFFHCSSKRKCGKTDSNAYLKEIFKALDDMRTFLTKE